MSEKSIIIIGAGMAGLSAGCYARMNGYQSRIFELHNIPGGLCTSWKRKEYTIDGCIHWLVGSRSGMFNQFYKELGAVQDRQMVDNEEFIRVEGDEGKTLIVYTDIDRLEQHLKELSPADADVIEEFCSAVRLLGQHELPIKRPRELMGLFDLLKMANMRQWVQTVQKYGKISIQAFSSRFKDPFLRKAFPLTFEDMPNFSVLAVMVTLADLHKKNAGIPIGGSLEFARAIEKRYMDLGGEIHYKSRVEKVVIENNRAVGIRLTDGTEHRADIVISAADGHSTIFDMLEGKYIDDSINNYYNEWPIYGPCIQISLGVARDFSNQPHRIIMPFEEAINIGKKTHNWASLRHYCYDPGLAPAGKSVVIVSFMSVKYEYWKKLYEDTPSYKSEKKNLADAVINQLEKRFPGIKAEIEVVDVATPMTYERYTGNWQGSYMGWRDTPVTMGKSMGRTLPGLKRFYMAGQWVYPGGGIPGSVMSGRHLMQIICNKDSKRFKATIP
ncbi:phytoene desaturase family protein [Bacteroidota bacterium]